MGFEGFIGCKWTHAGGIAVSVLRRAWDSGKHKKLRFILFFSPYILHSFICFFFHFFISSPHPYSCFFVACAAFLLATLVHLASQKYVIAYLVLVCARLDNC